MDIKGKWQSFQEYERRNMLIGGVLLILIAVAGFLTLNSQVEPEDTPLMLEEQPSFGEGNNTVVVFSDYNCEFCKAYYQDIHGQVHENFDVTSYHINYPVLGESSIGLAKLSECAYEQQGDNSWDYHMDMMTEEYNSTQGAIDLYEGNQSEFNACLQNNSEEFTVNQRIQDDINAGVSRGFRQTPTILVNGEQVEPSYESISEALGQ